MRHARLSERRRAAPVGHVLRGENPGEALRALPPHRWPGKREKDMVNGASNDKLTDLPGSARQSPGKRSGGMGSLHAGRSTRRWSRFFALTVLTTLFCLVSAGDLYAQALNRPLRSVHIGGNWLANREAVAEWYEDPTQLILPLDYIEHLKHTHVDWVGISIALQNDDSMDSTVERSDSLYGATPTFPDAALRQMIREYRTHGFDVYLTLAFGGHESAAAERPVRRPQLGDPGDPDTGVPPDHEEGCSDWTVCALEIKPEFWPWRPSHPDHERFVQEFWRTYTDQAVHFARIAQEEGVRMYSLGTETERLFRTRPSGHYWRNDFREELEFMVQSVRSQYRGLLTYDMHFSAIKDFPIVPSSGSPASRHLWDDLDLDVVGISAWFPLVREPPSTVMSVDELQQIYERLFKDYLVPLSTMNPGRPIVFLEYGAADSVDAPANPADGSLENVLATFSDINGNGVDDGEETQANIFKALFETMDKYPGLVYGAFFWDNEIASNEKWRTERAIFHSHSFRDKAAEEVVRAQYDSFRPLLWLPARALYVGGDPAVFSVGGTFGNASAYRAFSSAPGIATVSMSGSQVTVTPVAQGVTIVTVTATGADGAVVTAQFTVTVQGTKTNRTALEALYRSTRGDDWTNNEKWLTDAPIGDWFGVWVDVFDRVTQLRLGGWDATLQQTVSNGLAGTLPAELGDLGFLRQLQIEGSPVTGPIPAELGSLTNLQGLNFGNNALTGAIPAELGDLRDLRALNLGGNALTGTIPATLANLTSLEWLSLWGNAWTSKPAPEWLGALTGLKALDLGGHQFTGPVPATWRNLGNLYELFLWGNALTGSIPTWFGSLTRLRSLDFNGNALTGRIPASLTRLSELAQFDIRGTGVCVPGDPAIHAWLATIAEFRSSGLTCGESPPMVAATLPNRTLAEDDTLDVDVSRAFVDPDGDALSYRVSSSAPQVVTASVTGALVMLAAGSEGAATIRVTATDPGGLSAAQSFAVTVSSPANRPPEPVGALPPLTMQVDEAAVAVDVASAFRDPDGDLLTYRATSSALHAVTVRVAGARVTLTAVGVGRTAIEVTATDPDGLSAGQSFRVRVTAPFTDDPIRPGVTPVRVVHFTELRARIDVLRRAAELAPFPWTDPVLRAGVTPVRLAHLLELREALAAAYAVAGRAAPSWTDAAPAAGSTPIRAAHLMELRAAVVALE